MMNSYSCRSDCASGHPEIGLCNMHIHIYPFAWSLTWRDSHALFFKVNGYYTKGEHLIEKRIAVLAQSSRTLYLLTIVVYLF